MKFVKEEFFAVFTRMNKEWVYCDESKRYRHYTSITVTTNNKIL